MSVAVERKADPDVYVETCLGRVCDAIGISDEGKRAALPAPEIDVEWEEPPGTLRLFPSSAPSGQVMPSGEYPVGTHAALAAAPLVPPPIPTVRVARAAPSRGVHPAVLLCAFVSIVAVGASYLWSPAPSASKVRAHTSALLGLASR